jgi:hypothetical protein
LHQRLAALAKGDRPVGGGLGGGGLWHSAPLGADALGGTMHSLG